MVCTIAFAYCIYCQIVVPLQQNSYLIAVNYVRYTIDIR